MKHRVLLLSTTLAAGMARCAPTHAQKGEAARPELPTVTVTTVASRALARELRLPGELTAFQDVSLHPKVAGFVEDVRVDRGSAVRRGQVLVQLSAPELASQKSEADAKARGARARRTEAEAKLASVRAQVSEAEARLAAEEATYRRLKSASATPGVVAGNDLEVAERTAEGGRARVLLAKENEKAAAAEIRSLEEAEKAALEAARGVASIESYLRVTAPFDGVITERNVHPGSLVGPGGSPLVRLQQVTRLRLTVAVPEASVSGVKQGAAVKFTVPAFPGETWSGTVSRIAHALEPRTRTMPVELDVPNPAARLAPGMYAEVAWPAGRAAPSLFVPPSAIATTTERSFVVRVRGGVVEWVDVRRGMAMGNLVEIFGNLSAGDTVALRGTDELRAGTRVQTRPTS